MNYFMNINNTLLYEWDKIKKIASNKMFYNFKSAQQFLFYIFFANVHELIINNLSTQKLKKKNFKKW